MRLPTAAMKWSSITWQAIDRARLQSKSNGSYQSRWVPPWPATLPA
jgi:hypothetical protein